MLNPFPIQFLALFAYFILRVTVGATLLHFAFSHFKTPGFTGLFRLVITAELTIGTLLLLGLGTQYAALGLMGYSVLLGLIKKKTDHGALPAASTLFLCFGIGLSLFITGAGVFAFDLPI